MDRQLYRRLLDGNWVAIITKKRSTLMYGVYISERKYFPGWSTDEYWICTEIDWRTVCKSAKKEAERLIPENLAWAFKYKPTTTWILPWLSLEYAKHGIAIEYIDGNFVRYFTRLPEIRVRTNFEYSEKGRATLNKELQSVSQVYAELLATHQTPYVDEVLAIREIRKLPSPVAGAIIDCTRAVQLRRFLFKHEHETYYPLNSVETWKREVLYTYADMYGEVIQWPHWVITIPAEKWLAWEDAAAFIHAGP